MLITIANIRDFIDSLPMGYNTKIGMGRQWDRVRDSGSGS